MFAEAVSRSDNQPEDVSETGSTSSSIHSQNQGGSARNESFVEVSIELSSDRYSRPSDPEYSFRKVFALD